MPTYQLYSVAGETSSSAATPRQSCPPRSAHPHGATFARCPPRNAASDQPYVHRPFQPDLRPQDSKTGWTHSVETRHVHTSPDFIATYVDITRQRQSLLPQVGFDETRIPAHQISSGSPVIFCTPICPRPEGCRRKRLRPNESASSASWTTSPRPNTSDVRASPSITSTAGT